MAAASEDDAGVGKQVRDALKRLRDTATLFQADRSAFDEGTGRVAESLSRITGAHGEVELNVSTNRIMVGEDEVYKSESRTGNLAFDLFRQGLRRITFKPGLSTDEVSAFVRRFAECRSADQIDEDFVTSMWQESLPNISFIALDNFTEKIFMSETEFVGRFRSVLDDIVPGLFEMDDEDTDEDVRDYSTVDSAAQVDKADLEQRKVRKAISGVDDSVRGELFRDDAMGHANAHLIHICARDMLRTDVALSTSELQGILVRILTSYLETGDWQGFADAIRSLRPVFAAGPGLLPSVAERVEKVQRVVSGRDMAEQIAEHLDPEQTNFTAWARWYFVTEGTLTAPGLLELVNGCSNSAGRDWLKDLLRRQSTASLDPWAERLRDPNPGIVIEVIDVIMSSELGGKAQDLLLETLVHSDPSVRSRGLEALAGCYDQSVRQALLPLLKDPDAQVRRGVVRRFVEADDKSVGPYLANLIKSGEVLAFGEDEQREIFEAVARLTGARFLDLFREKLQLEEEGLFSKFLKKEASAINDTATRRAVISGLALMASSDAKALVQEVQSRAELALAAHCDVALRLNLRSDGPGEMSNEPIQQAPIEDVSVGKSRMGDGVLFTPQALNLDGVLAERGVRLSDIPKDATPPSVARRAGPDEQRRTAVYVADGAPDLGTRPLFSHTVVFEPWDRLKLAANPASVSGERFQLVDIEVSLVGITDAAGDARRQREKSMPPVRIIERSVEIADRSHTHLEAETPVEDLLRGYLDSSVDGASEQGSVDTMFGESQPPENVDELLREYVDEPPEQEQGVEEMLRNYLDVPKAPEPVVNSGGGNVYIAPEVRVDSPGKETVAKPPSRKAGDSPAVGKAQAAVEDDPSEVDDVLRSYLDSDSEN